jgi:hypothetical protein
MKKLVLSFALMFGVLASKAQVISVQGGNVTYKGKNYGFSQVEVSGSITKDISAVGSYSKVLAGYDVSTVGFRHSLWKDKLGVQLNGAYIQNHTFQPMFGIDLKISPQVRLAFSSSFNDKLRFVGLKVPVYKFHKD